MLVRGTMREIIFGCALSVAVAAAALLLAAQPSSGQPMASFFPAGISAGQAIAAIDEAGGDILQFGATPALVISVSDAPDHAARLYRSGAWLVVDARLARLCLNLEPRNAR